MNFSYSFKVVNGSTRLKFNGHYIDIDEIAFIEPTNDNNNHFIGCSFHFKEDPTKYISINCTEEEYTKLLNDLVPSK